MKEISSRADIAAEKAQRMLSSGVTQFEWMHSGVPLKCGTVDHSKRDGKRYSLADHIASGKPLPGAEEGCRCTFIAVL